VSGTKDSAAFGIGMCWFIHAFSEPHIANKTYKYARSSHAFDSVRAVLKLVSMGAG
jgi:hypothetical protein